MIAAVRLCHLDELSDGDARGFDPLGSGRDSLFVIRDGSELIGYLNACPHRGYEGTSMAWRKDQFLNKARDRILCGAHGAQFDIRTGECLRGPCPGQSLTPVQLTINEHGDVYLHPTDTGK